MLAQYIEVEKVYNQHNFQVEDAIRAIRSSHPDNLEAVYKVALSHARLISKNHLVLKTLALIPLVMVCGFLKEPACLACTRISKKVAVISML